MFDDGRIGFDEGRPVERGSLRGYLDTVLERRWFVVSAVVVCILAAAVYVATASKQYQAHADMLITPIPANATNVVGLGLLRGATDPSGDFATASRLIDNAQVAAQVRRDLHLTDSAQDLLQQITVEPVANSSIVAITAATGSPGRSQQLANGFAVAAVQVRTAALYRALDPAIKNMRAEILSASTGQTPAASANTTAPLYQQLAALQALRSAPDPTIQFETPAALPTGQSSPKTKLAILGGLLAGLLIGVTGAFLLNAIDPRRSREGGLELTGLAVLTRVPLLGRNGRMRHAFDESFRSLRMTLRFATTDDPIATIAVTSASEKEGKTTTSFQLAMAMLEAGHSVLLVEADPFRPGLRALVGRDQESGKAGLLEYLSGTADLDDIIQRAPVPGLMFISAGLLHPVSITGLLEGDRGRTFVSDVSGLADIVIMDCPPVGPRSDAVLIASGADAVLVVVDLQHSTERDVLETVRRLRRTGARLLGIVLNRDSSPGATYDYGDPDEKPKRFGGLTLSRR